MGKSNLLFLQCIGVHYNTYAEIVGKFKITYKQHIKDGVGLPLNVIHGLNRWVTARHRTCTCTHS